MMFWRKPKVKTVYISAVKDWSNAGYELEAIGRRLDAVRGTIAFAEQVSKPGKDWALRHWMEAEAILLRKWLQTMRLKDVGMRQVNKNEEGPRIDYSWWEGSCEPLARIPIFDNIGDWLNEKFGFSYNDLNASWEKAREEKLQKARQGLA